ncbi:MAG: response regulator transcription factor [Lachnospiraceae bacterium]|nr:response regulator transcription factor [Lachnospiraceae bacterium]
MRILLIEDDIDLSRSLGAMLEKQGFSVTICGDGEEGLFYILENSHDLILLDRMLPGMDGMEVLKRARAAHCAAPVIFLTAVGALGERISGLDCGADDYIVKPFAFEELMARIRCVCRRPQRISDADLPGFGDLSYDPAQSLLRCGDKTCTLSRREGDLLLLFLNNPDQMLPRSMILSRVWGPDAEIEDGNLDNYIHFLRRRLRAVESRLVLKTARGIGYRLMDTQSTHELIG